VVGRNVSRPEPNARCSGPRPDVLALASAAERYARCDSADVERRRRQPGDRSMTRPARLLAVLLFAGIGGCGSSGSGADEAFAKRAAVLSAVAVSG
jgi:hypothetical protein